MIVWKHDGRKHYMIIQCVCILLSNASLLMEFDLTSDDGIWMTI